MGNAKREKTKEAQSVPQAQLVPQDPKAELAPQAQPAPQAPQAELAQPARGATGATGPTGTLSSIYGSFFNEPIFPPFQTVPGGNIATRVQFPTPLVIPPVGVTMTTTATGSIFTVASDGVYNVSWGLELNNTEANVASITLILNGTPNLAIPITILGLDLPAGNSFVSNTELVSLSAADTYSLSIALNATGTILESVISIFEVAPLP